MSDVAPLLEQQVHIAAAPEAVWAVVGDPTRMTEWSRTLASVRLKAETAAVGVRFTNKNVDGELEWITHAEITEFDPPRRIAYRVEENWAIWSLEVTADGAGAVLTQRRETPEGISDLSRDLTDGFQGGQDVYQASLLADMATTLEEIKRAVERA